MYLTTTTMVASVAASLVALSELLEIAVDVGQQLARELTRDAKAALVLCRHDNHERLVRFFGRALLGAGATATYFDLGAAAGFLADAFHVGPGRTNDATRDAKVIIRFDAHEHLLCERVAAPTSTTTAVSTSPTSRSTRLRAT
jgi:hypothetical protein